MKIRILLVFLLFSTICYAAGWDELNRVQIEDTLGDTVGVTGNSLEVVDDNSSAIKDSLDALDNAVAGNEIQVDIVSGAASGTEYTEGDTDATIDGQAILWEDASDTLRAVSASKPLPIDITDASVAVTGTFYQVTQPISGTVDITETSFDATQATATNLKAQIFGDDITSALDVDANGQLQVDILSMPSTTVTATDLDIRDLAVTTDDILIYANTVKDGSGTNYVPLVDADGNLQVDVLSAPTTAVTGTFYQVTQPVSGTVTANAGTNLNTSALATSAKQLADGHNVTIDNGAAGSAVNIQDGGNAITVDGNLTTVTTLTGITNTVTVDGAVTVSGTATVTQAGAIDTELVTADLDVGAGTDTEAVVGLQIAKDGGAVLIGAGAAGDSLPINDDGGAITVDGSVTVSGTATVTQAGTVSVDDNASSLTVDTTGTAGLEVVQSVAGDLNVTEASASDIKTAVQLIDDMIYVDDTAVHATGTTKGAGIMAAATPTDTSVAANDIGMVAMSTDRRLLIDAQIVGSDADINVEVTETEFDSDLTKIGGTAVAANAGVLSAGVQRVTIATDDEVNNDIDAIMTAVQIIDDWDDTNYANVNMNVAGTDVTAAEGVIDAQTLRVTVSTDDEINDDLDAIKTAIEKIDEDNISTVVATVYNVTMTDADTEYSQAFTNVESLMFQCRGEFDTRYQFVTGKVATPTAPWMTLKSGAVYSEEFYDGVVDFTLYFACDDAAQIVEIEVK